MLTAPVAVGGTVLAVALARAARRADAGDHARSLGPGARWRLPAGARAWLARALEDAALDLEPEGACQLWLAATVAVTMVTAVVTPGLALPVALIGAGAGPVGLRIARGRARRRYAAALPGALDQVAAALRGGATVPEALAAVAAGAGPLAPDLRRVGARTALGLGFADALAAWPAERDLPSVRAAAGALAVAATLGGRSADAIDGLARSVRERLGALAEARALSAQARLSAIVVGVAPLAYLAFSALVDPSSVDVLVTSHAGRVCLVLGLALDGLGILWMRHIVRGGEAE